MFFSYSKPLCDNLKSCWCSIQLKSLYQTTTETHKLKWYLYLLANNSKITLFEKCVFYLFIISSVTQCIFLSVHLFIYGCCKPLHLFKWRWVASLGQNVCMLVCRWVCLSVEMFSKSKYSKKNQNTCFFSINSSSTYNLKSDGMSVP